MGIDADPRTPRAQRRTRTLLATVFVIVCLGPHLDRLQHPGLFTDDVKRINDLQTQPLSRLLFRPVQEHMAPFFETVSWVTWQLAGQRLKRAPLAFTVASYLPFVISLGLLGLVIHRELRSTTTALVGVAAYSLSSLPSEAIYWYSASSFFWAMAWTLVTLYFAAAATEGNRRWCLAWAGVAAGLSPACSAIGVLAGPLGAIRIASSPGPTWRRVRFDALVPLLGTLMNLAVCSIFRYSQILASSIEHRASFASGLIYAFCAPANVLLPDLFGLGKFRVGSPAGLNLAVAVAGLAGIVFCAWRSQSRGLVLGGVWLVLGGYTMTYSFRTQQFGTEGLFDVSRYHVFPLLGFVLWLAWMAGPWLRRFDRRPTVGLALATTIAALLMVVHLPSILNRSRFYDFPSQHLTLRALERVDQICRREGITRDQVLAALECIWLRWSHSANPLAMLPESVRSPVLPDAVIRRTILDALTPAEREALWGGMDASPFIKPAATLGSGNSAVAVGRLVGFSGIRENAQGQYVTTGRPSYVEFELPVEASQYASATAVHHAKAPTLCLPRDYASCRMEVWWAEQDAKWSETRSVRWRPDPEEPSRDLAVSLDHLPHWNADKVRRMRLVFRSSASIAIGPPRLIR
jgi:hypothetical protein